MRKVNEGFYIKITLFLIIELNYNSLDIYM